MSEFADTEKITSLRGNYYNLNFTLGINKKPITTQAIVNFMLLLSYYRHKNHKHLFEINRFYEVNWAKNISNEEFVRILNNLPEGTTEFICHLAILSDEGNRKFLGPRNKTLSLLTKPNIKKHLISNGINLVRHKPGAA